MQVRLDQVVVDAQRPKALARSWAGLLGGRAVDRAHGWSHVEAAGFVRVAFQPVPEGEVTENRLHLDLEVDDITAAAAAVIDLGGCRLGEVATTELGSYLVMRDPEGNEFCLVHDWGA